MISIILCWGSFLNMLAYRLVHDVNLLRSRSFCPKCNKTIFWYDNIPLISWVLLKGKCRNCHKPISVLYPFIEILSVIVFILLLYRIPFPYFISYFIFFSALIVAIRTDIETMLISRFTSIFLIPLAIVLNLLGYLPLTISQTLYGALFGYFLLFSINKIYYLLTKRNGIGQGDMELLAMIGAFTSLIGCWISLLIGSILGSIVGILLVLLKKVQITNKLPFGPFLAIGAIVYVLFTNEIISLIF